MNIHNNSEKVFVKCILIGVPCDEIKEAEIHWSQNMGVDI